MTKDHVIFDVLNYLRDEPVLLQFSKIYLDSIAPRYLHHLNPYEFSLFLRERFLYFKRSISKKIDFKLFFSDVLYKPSSGNTDGFNRHIIVHMLKNDFNNPANFIRIFLALTHIMFIESLNNQSVPFFWPGYNDNEEVKGMSAYIRLMSERFGEPRRRLLNQFEISQYGGSV